MQNSQSATKKSSLILDIVPHLAREMQAGFAAAAAKHGKRDRRSIKSGLWSDRVK
jgi:hypothetical protein